MAMNRTSDRSRCSGRWASASSPLRLLLLVVFSATVGANAGSFEAEQEVKAILERMAADTLAFRDQVEAAYANRCSSATLSGCGYANHNDCNSVFPNQQCMDPEELVMQACGTGENCNALWDKTVSTVALPAALAPGPNDNPTDPEIIETACYTKQAENYMVQKYKDDENFWAQYGAAPSWTYFGAHNGLFRQLPATQAQVCGRYDPRRRPWFVAASSGPKDVVLVIDVSGSMDDYGRMGLAKDAAITIIETLTVADRVAIVPFSDGASILAGEAALLRATQSNKDKLISAVSGLRAGGSTNFYAGFEHAFNALDTTIERESTSGCNIAVLFLTDGQSTKGPGANEVISLVNQRTAKLKNQYGRKAVVFTFSLGVNADHDVMKSIACQTDGIWTPVDDYAYGGDLVSAMSSYYKLFALGLGEGDNEEFTAWVEPYMFFTEGKMGTTVSAPVFDRSVDPPLFLGVVGVDSLMDALEQVLGEDASSSAMLDRFVLLSTARCPELNLTECELDALRFLGGGEEATCGGCTSGYAGIVPKKCPTVSDLPRNLWENTDMEGKSYPERACCEIGESVPSDQCTGAQGFGAGSVSTGAIVGIVIGVVALALFVCCYCYFSKGKKTRNAYANGNANINKPAPSEIPTASVVTNSKTPYDGVVAAPPPTAPGYVQH